MALGSSRLHFSSHETANPRLVRLSNFIPLRKQIFLSEGLQLCQGQVCPATLNQILAGKCKIHSQSQQKKRCRTLCYLFLGLLQPCYSCSPVAALPKSCQLTGAISQSFPPRKAHLREPREVKCRLRKGKRVAQSHTAKQRLVYL